MVESADVFRHDTLEIEKRQYRLDSQGFMHVGATLTTVGVYKYPDGRGGFRREYRPASEVQSPRFLNSLKGAVVTNEHLPNKAPVTIRNVKRYQVGQLGDDITVKGLKVDGNLTLTDMQTVTDVHSGAKRGVSIGYRCKTTYNPGVWDSPSGPVPYDYVQSGHMANHICITGAPRGGLGRDGTSLHLDSLESELVETEERTIMNTVSITIDGLALPLPSEAAPIIQTALNKRDSLLGEKDKTLATQVTKIAELEAEKKELVTANEKLTVDSEKQVNVGILVKSRLELLQKATGLLEDGALDAIDSEADDYESLVMDAVLEANDVDLDNAAKLYTDSTLLDVYKRATFDQIVKRKGDDAHSELSTSVVTTSLNRGDSRKGEPAHRKDIRARLKIAQNKRDGTHVETTNA